MYKNSCLKIIKPLTLGLILTNIKNISKTSINKYAEIGSPCRVPLFNLKSFANVKTKVSKKITSLFSAVNFI